MFGKRGPWREHKKPGALWRQFSARVVSGVCANRLQSVERPTDVGETPISHQEDQVVPVWLVPFC